jgi:hypothetical protein
MRSEAELQAACEAFAWYFASGRYQRQNAETQNNLIGTVAALEWMKGDGANNPVAGTLRDIAAMRAGPERN